VVRIELPADIEHASWRVWAEKGTKLARS